MTEINQPTSLEITETAEPVSPLKRLEQMAARYKEQDGDAAATIAEMLKQRHDGAMDQIRGSARLWREGMAISVPAVILQLVVSSQAFPRIAEITRTFIDQSSSEAVLLAGAIVGAAASLAGIFLGEPLGEKFGLFLGEKKANYLSQQTIAMLEQTQPTQTAPPTETQL